MFIKKKTFWLMLFLLIIGAYFRVIFINKPEGLWNDEYISWFVASIPYGKEFWDAVFWQCHMPFYYLYLKFFIHFFGNSDLLLRITSFIPGVLSIIPMYFVGKEFKDEKLGILCASVTAFSSFLIYYSQEVRFYGLLFLFSALVLLFMLKLLKKRNLSNIIFYTFFNLLIIFTHTIGFVFVFFNLIFVSYFLLKESENDSKAITYKVIFSLLGIIFLLSLISLPLLIKILTSHPQSQWWGHFTLAKLGFLMTDYFSPVLTNLINAPDKFFVNVNLQFIIFKMLPVLIAVIGIIKAVSNENNKLSGLFYCFLAVIFVLSIASISGKLIFLTKYSIEIYPILILLMSFGLLDFKKELRYFLIFWFCFFNLFYLLTNPASAPKLKRGEGNKLVADLLQNAQLKENDFIILNYYPKERFEKYFNFDKYNVISIHKGNFLKYINVKDKQSFRDIDDKFFDNKIKNLVLNKIKPNQKVAIINLNNVAMFSPFQIKVTLETEKTYRRIPFLFLAFSYIKNQEIQTLLKKLKATKLEKKGDWEIITFIK